MKVARLALSMLQAGLIEDSESSDSLVEVVTQGLSRWLETALGPCEVLKLSARLHEDAFEAIGFSANPAERSAVTDAVEKDFGLSPEVEHMALLFGASERIELRVGTVVTQLEEAAAGLGFELLHQIERLGIHFGVMGAGFMEYAAGSLYWAGGSSEDDWATEWASEGEEFYGLKRDEFDAEYPKEWSDRQKANDDVLASALTHADATVRTVANLVTQARAFSYGGDGFGFGAVAQECEWEESLEPSVLLTWDSFNVAYRIGDDFMEGRGGDYPECPGIGMAMVPVSAPKWFKKQEKSWSKTRRAVQMLDAMLVVVQGSRK